MEIKNLEVENFVYHLSFHSGLSFFPFLFSILWGGWCSTHTQEDLAKFGYMSERRVGKKVKILALVWVLARTYSLNMANSDCFSLKYGDLGPFSFPGKSLCMSCMAHFFVYGAKIRSPLWISKMVITTFATSQMHKTKT